MIALCCIIRNILHLNICRCSNNNHYITFHTLLLISVLLYLGRDGDEVGGGEKGMGKGVGEGVGGRDWGKGGLRENIAQSIQQTAESAS